MNDHERIAFVVDMLNSLSSRPDDKTITIAEYYEYRWQDLLNILIDLLWSIDPSFNQQLARYNLENAVREILRSLSTINYEPSSEIRDNILSSASLEEALSQHEDIYTDILYYLLSNLEDNKETYYLSAFTSPIQIGDPTLQLDNDIIKLLNDLDTHIIQFMDLRSRHSQLAQDLRLMGSIKRDLLIKEDRKNQLDNRLQDIKNKFQSTTNNRHLDVFAVCQQVAQKEMEKRKLLQQNEKQSEEIEYIRKEIFALQSEEREFRQLLMDCELLNTPQEVTEKLEAEIYNNLYQIRKIYKPDLDDLTHLLEEIVQIENEIASWEHNKTTTSNNRQNYLDEEKELEKRIESIEDQIDEYEKELKNLTANNSKRKNIASGAAAAAADNTNNNDLTSVRNINTELISSEDDNFTSGADGTIMIEIDGELLDGRDLNLQIGRLIRSKDELIKEFQHLSSVYIESNEQLEAIRQTNGIRLPKEFDNLAELCEQQSIDSILKARKHKYDDCLIRKKELEAKILNLQHQIIQYNDRYKEQLDKIENLERDNNIVGYFNIKHTQEKEANETINDETTTKDESQTNNKDIEVDVDDNGIVDWNGVDIDRLKEQIDGLKMEIEQTKDSLDIDKLENLRKEYKKCQTRLKELKEPYDQMVLPIKVKLSQLESTKQELQGELDQLTSVTNSKKNLIEFLKNILEKDNSNNNKLMDKLDIGSLNEDHLGKQKKMWQTIEAWLDCLADSDE